METCFSLNTVFFKQVSDYICFPYLYSNKHVYRQIGQVFTTPLNLLATSLCIIVSSCGFSPILSVTRSTLPRCQFLFSPYPSPSKFTSRLLTLIKTFELQLIPNRVNNNSTIKLRRISSFQIYPEEQRWYYSGHQISTQLFRLNLSPP